MPRRWSWTSRRRPRSLGEWVGECPWDPRGLRSQACWPGRCTIWPCWCNLVFRASCDSRARLESDLEARRWDTTADTRSISKAIRCCGCRSRRRWSADECQYALFMERSSDCWLTIQIRACLRLMSSSNISTGWPSAPLSISNSSIARSLITSSPFR